MHEASLHERNCFITLTYDDEHLPVRKMLDYPAFQKFLKRLRKFAGSEQLRFYMCGEYGSRDFRPHYHACVFGFDFRDKVHFATSEAGSKVYRSPSLERLWSYGFSSVGAVGFESAAYVARYCVAKVTGVNARLYYRRQDADGEYFLPPEFNRMSLKPPGPGLPGGIGAAWYARFKADVYPHDYVVVNGKEVQPPKYYDRLFSAENPLEFEDIQFRREVRARANFADNSDDRLLVKEIVQRARLDMLKRSI